MSKFKKFTIIHYSLLVLSLMYSFYFYKEISWELAILAVLFELFKPVLFINAIDSRKSSKYLFVSAVIVLVTFNLLAISSSFINTYNKQSTSKTVNEAYKIHNKRLEGLKSNIDSIKTELNNYPTFESFTERSPRWEDKTQLNQNWQSGKQDITNRLNSANTEYSKELSNNVNQYNTIANKMGYSAIFTALSKQLKVDTKNFILCLYLMFAVMLEILIFYSKTLSNKEIKGYKKTNDELTKELIEEINLEIHKRQIEAIKNIFNNNLPSKNNMPVLAYETPRNDTKIIIEDAKEQQQQKVKKIEASKDFEINDVMDPLLEKNNLVELKESKTLYQYTKKPLDIENIRKYMNYLLENSKDDIAIGYKKVGESLGLTQGEAIRIYNKLLDTKYLEKADKRTTKIKKTNFNENDFLEV
jgi:predicted PurR-regulated permease PerM